MKLKMINYIIIEKKIAVKADDINIPQVSVFKIEDGNLVLIDNYLSEYEENIILK